MDRTLKERLIGAAVLVALGVWLIPWVLDGPDQVASDDADADILALPAPDGAAEPRRTQTVELDVTRPESAGPVPGASGSAVEDEAEPIESVARTDEAGEDAGPARGNEAPAAQPLPAVPVASEREVPKGAQRADGPGATGWWVQLGSFGDEANARRLSSRVSGYGYEPRISNFMASGRLMYRVRVGPLPTRVRAETTASSLSAHGFVAQLIPPE